MVRQRRAPGPRGAVRAARGVHLNTSTLRAPPPRIPRASLARRARVVPVRPRPQDGRGGRHVRTLLIVIAFATLAGPVPAQDSLVTVAERVTVARARVPFGVGERAEYQVKFGPVSVGSGMMEVSAIDS